MFIVIHFETRLNTYNQEDTVLQEVEEESSTLQNVNESRRKWPK